MTNQTIPPCPLCGTVPEVDAQFDDECKPRCGHIRSPVATIMIDDWTHSCNYELGRACRELGIETAEQLKTRLEPDKDYTFLLSIIHWAIAFWDAVPNDTLMYYTPPLPKGIDLDYLRDLVKGVKYPPRLADDSPVAPDPRVAVLESEIKRLQEVASSVRLFLLTEPISIPKSFAYIDGLKYHTAASNERLSLANKWDSLISAPRGEG